MTLLQLLLPLAYVVQSGADKGLLWFRNEPSYCLWGLPIFPLVVALFVAAFNKEYFGRFRRSVRYLLGALLIVLLVGAVMVVYRDKYQGRHPARPPVFPAVELRNTAYELDSCLRSWAWSGDLREDCHASLGWIVTGTVSGTTRDSVCYSPQSHDVPSDIVCLNRVRMDSVLDDRPCGEVDTLDAHSFASRRERGCWAEAVYLGFVKGVTPDSLRYRSGTEITAWLLTLGYALFIVIFLWYVLSMTFMLIVDEGKVESQDRNTAFVIYLLLLIVAPLKLYSDWYQFFYDLRPIGAYQGGLGFALIALAAGLFFAVLFTPGKPLHIVNGLVAAVVALSTLVGFLKPSWIPVLAHTFETLDPLMVVLLILLSFFGALVLILRVAGLDLISMLEPVHQGEPAHAE